MRKSYIFNFNRKAALLIVLFCLCIFQSKPLKAASSGNTWTNDGWTYTYNLDDNDNATITKVVPTGYEEDGTGWIASLTEEQQNDFNNRIAFIDFTFPDKVDGHSVVSILCGERYDGMCVFSYVTQFIRSIVVPQGVTSLGSYCFADAYNVSSISLPEGLLSIATGALDFYYTDATCKLTSLTIPSTVTTLSQKSIGSNSLTAITFAKPSQLKSVACNTFNMCSKLKSISLPASVTTITGQGNTKNAKKKATLFSSSAVETVLLEGDGIAAEDLHCLSNKSVSTSIYYPLSASSKYSNATVTSNNKKAKKRFYAESRIVKTNSRYGTICLPYTISASECANITAFYEEKSENAINDDQTYITFDQVTTLEAGKPYIFEQTGTAADDGTFTAADANGLVVFAIADADETPLTAEVNTGTYFKGTFEGKSYDDLKGGSNYILQSDGVFRKVGAKSVKVGTYRAYLDLSSLLNGVKSNKISINFKNSETTGIDGLTNDEGSVNNGWMYNLQGQRITTPAHGQLYIKNGKKYIKN